MEARCPSPDQQLVRLFERSPIGMYRTLADGTFLYANSALAKLLGYPLDELYEKNLNRDIYANPGARAKLIADYVGSGHVDGARVEWRHRDGHTLIVQVFGHFTDGADGERTFDASIVDITERERAAATLRAQHDALEESSSILDLVVKQIPAVWWVMDRDLRILSNGGDMFGVMGFSHERFMNRTLYDSEREGFATRESVMQHERVLQGETITTNAEFAGKALTSTFAPLRRDGQIVGVIGTSIDVTVQRALERRMVDAQRAESLGVLAGGLAHDFNNLLVAILGNVDLGLRDTQRSHPSYASMENVRAAALRAAELTDQLLAYAGHGGVGSMRVPAKEVVDELVRIAGPTIPPHVAITVDIPEALAVRGDAGQLRQVFLNLITNARDALGADGGTIAIRAESVRHDGVAVPEDVVVAAAGAYVLFDVTDNGPGIDREQRRRIFEPFFTTKPTGHGLGLAAVLGIVRAHGGGLRLVTAPGEGARFEVRWPASTTPTQAVAAVKAPVAALRTVLVIDDEDLVRDVVARMVEDLGYTALTAVDGVAGLAVVDAQVVDAVLVDLTMPRMNGADVVAELRRKRPTLPVVLCTGYDRDRRGPVQADAYLPKPFRLEALESTLAKIFRAP